MSRSSSLSCKIEEDFGLEMYVLDNEILELSVVVRGTFGEFPIIRKSKIYEKPWEDYLSPEELKEFVEMEF